MAARAVRCALEQRDVETEVVVVDDGSAERAPSRRPFLDERVRVVRHPTARGLSGARNRGVAEARTEWVAFLDDDDLWAPEKLHSQLRAAREMDAEFAYCGAYQVDADLRVRARRRATPVEALPIALLEYNAIPAGGSNILVKREVLVSHGVFDESLPHLCDWDLSLRLTDVAVRMAALDDPLIAYTQHEDNMGASARRLVPEWRRFLRKHRALARRVGRSFRSDKVIAWYVWRLQLGGRRWRAAITGLLWGLRLRNLELIRGRAAKILRPSATVGLLPPVRPGPAWLPRPPHR
ncbi:MAG TPA: glycosyltransferase, partial [Solirubrobacterales bacterium]|nr:glycosyltransferase [Solirubrobacterales bacterium]